jgi:hypothetical protein
MREFQFRFQLVRLVIQIVLENSNFFQTNNTKKDFAQPCSIAK